MALHLFGLALLMGAIISIYFPLIAKSAQVLGSAPLANVPFFFIAFVASVVIAFVSGARVEQFQKITSLPLGLLTAGIMSAVLIIGSSFDSQTGAWDLFCVAGGWAGDCRNGIWLFRAIWCRSIPYDHR